MTAAPRIEPLPESQWDPELSEIFGRESDGGLPTSGKVLNIFRTLAHHPKLLKRWLVFGYHVLGKSTLRAARARAADPAHRLALPERSTSGDSTRASAAGRPHRRRDPAHRRGAPTLRAGAPSTRSCCAPPTSCTTTRCVVRRHLGALGGAVRRAADARPGLRRRPVHAGLDGAQQLRRSARARRRGLPRRRRGPRLLTRTERGERLEDKIAIVVGAGQTPGDTIGNGRATAILFAREGARVLCVDRDSASARGDGEMILGRGRRGQAVRADVTREADCQRLRGSCARALTAASTCCTTTSASARGDGGPTHAHRGGAAIASST